MEMAIKLIRRSIHEFFHNYQFFTSVAVFLIFPASASVLLCQALTSISSFTNILQKIMFRIALMFEAACFPASSKLFALLSLKLSETILTFIFTLPLNLTFLLIAKAAIIQIFNESQHSKIGLPSFSSLLPIYRSILLTYVFNSFLIVSANATIFALLFIVFNALEVLGLLTGTSILALSATGIVLYSIVLSNTLIICNLALIVSGIDDCSDYQAVLRACLIIKGRSMTALGLVMSANLLMAAFEALFAYRVVRKYNMSRTLSSSVVWEALSITYIHAILVVFDVIISCMFFKTCSDNYTVGYCSNSNIDMQHPRELEPEEKALLPV